MKKALIVGGSNGIGLAISKTLLKNDYRIIIVDKNKPDENVINGNENYEYIFTDLLDFNRDLFVDLANDLEIDTLMITAGFGRVSEFKYLHTAEIEKIIKVNTTTGMQIIRCFYNRLLDEKSFDCGMMVSIAGMISSPLFSVYSASKAALFRFIESVNIELEMNGTNNRILNVSPSSISGTSFNGGKNDYSKIECLSEQIIENLQNKNELFIPKYDELLKNVIDRYNENPHDYGIYSYNYKMESGRVVNREQVCIGYLSGTFDLFHVGHLNLLKRAKEQCDYLIVGVHPNGSHKSKETFIPFQERFEIVESCKYVDKVVVSTPEDCDSVIKYNANRLFVGSDYKGTERFNRYEEMFKGTGVEIIYFPYTEGTSSTQIRNYINKKVSN